MYLGGPLLFKPPQMSRWMNGQTGRNVDTFIMESVHVTTVTKEFCNTPSLTEKAEMLGQIWVTESETQGSSTGQ